MAVQDKRARPDASLFDRALAPAPPEDALREKILDAAREQFMTFGLRRSTVDDVAKRARVSRVTVYRRIGNKDQLVQECLLREYRRFVTEVDEAVSALPTMEERMVEGFVVLLRHIRDHPLIGGLMRLEPELMLPYLTVDSGPSFLAMREYLAARLRHAQRTEGRPDRDPTPVAELMVRITVSFLLNPVSCFELDDDDQSRTFVRRYLVPLLDS
ncbi:TetR/AcrR family transcriptional regulator [Streptomyces gobiensis]|uniref:TetR/AcrR family transcriptional regulator n=1 Tax=Streptomyces gobiensis TaxID=2875706 RepID=UPI001E4D28C4|nr:TetR/AcrR family transcriptional regulator [Streptomyces gobiensis]UGY94474.1 TetR/AcrR family transcriptional regulator [Streptomyces gobiensis]